MLSRSGLYALQAALYLAQRDRTVPVSAARMAADLAVPPEYLAKVLARMKGQGVVSSTRGYRGGYRLLQPPSQLTVEDVVRPFDRVRPLKRCLLGGTCDTEKPCAAHLRRLEWNEARTRIFQATHLTDLLPPLGVGENGAAAAQLLDSNQGK